MAKRTRAHGFTKVLTVAAFTAAGFAMTVEPVAAQSSYCTRLHADYRALSRGSGGGSKANVSRLRSELSKAQRQARRNNCRRLFGRSRDCRSINAQVKSLQRKLNQASRGGSRVSSRSTSAQRDRLRAQMRRNGCNLPTGNSQWAGSGYRTLCVRTCDGFYFPINFRSSRSRFKVDETVCKAMYGGAGAELFYHSNGGSPDRAVSLKGKPLAAEPYAFAYRKSFSESCQGELKRGLANLGKAFEARTAAKAAEKEAAKVTDEPAAPMPIPVARVTTWGDPETLANRAGDFVPERIVPDPDGTAVAEIRRFGPDYYYEPSETITAIYEPPDLGPEFSLISSAHADERVEAGDAAVDTSVQ
ncbi:DUF2865 domain-containing protein [Bauldia sp.]|uniref:DUF2865 domain-containing protein n=1 Tax=Bauldia sp. TaxID=2575872 RepID=UPI003BAD9F68